MSILDEFVAERDAMIARSRRGVEREDGKTAGDWEASLGGVLSGHYPARHMWIKIGAVALRAIEAIDRKEDVRERRERCGLPPSGSAS